MIFLYKQIVIGPDLKTVPSIKSMVCSTLLSVIFQMMKLKYHFCYLILLFCLSSISGHEKQLQEEQEGDGGELK